MYSNSIKQNVYVSRQFEQINDEMWGYKIRIDGKDISDFKLVVALWWYLSDGEPDSNSKLPIQLGTHPFHELSECDLHRSEIFGSRIHIRVGDTSDGEKLIQLRNPPKCTAVDIPGRWLFYDTEFPCTLPYCTGDRLKTFITDHSWQGARLPWVWVPYDCYYHFYNPNEIIECANQLDISWIHVMGDSLAREIIGYLMSIFHEADTSKFDHADLTVANDTIRISFQSWNDLIDSDSGVRNETFILEMLDHYNILAPHTSQPVVLEQYKVKLTDIELTRPDVFVMNPAIAYSLYKQSTKVCCVFRH